MPSRRALLAGAAGAVGLGTGAASQYRPGIDPWAPKPDTWPTARYDPANTAENPTATVPDDPSVAWSVRPLNAIYENGLVVGNERVYAAGRGVAALDRSDGTVRWEGDGGGPVALADETLFVAPGEGLGGGREQMMRAFDIETGSERWSEQSVSEAFSVLPADGELFVGSEFGLVSLDTDSGRKRWATRAFYESIPLIYDGRLYATGGMLRITDSTGAYRKRSALSRSLGLTPELAWKRSHEGRPIGLTAADGVVVIGYFLSPRDEAPATECVDAETGEVRWREPKPVDEDSFPVRGGPLAVADGRCVAALSYANDDAVVCRALADGEEQWRVTTGGHLTDVAIVDGTVVFGTSGGMVRALDLETGDERWQADAIVGVTAVAPVDGSVFVASAGGRLLALR